MNPFVLNTVIKDCWNATGETYTTTVKPARVSKMSGNVVETRIARRYYKPPKTLYREALFHYFQIGDIEPYLFGVKRFIKDEWMNTEELMQRNEILINVGMNNGILFSPRDCWLKKNREDRNWVLAVMHNPMFNYGLDNVLLKQETVPNIVTTEKGDDIVLREYGPIKGSIQSSEVFIQFYRNPAYFSHEGRLNHLKVVSYESNNPPTAAKALEFLDKFYDRREEYLLEQENLEGLIVVEEDEEVAIIVDEDVMQVGWVLFNGWVSTLDYARRHVAELAQREIAVYWDETIKKKMWFRVDRLSKFKVHEEFLLGQEHNVFQLVTEDDDGIIVDKKTGQMAYLLRLGDKGFYNVDNVDLFLGTGMGNNFKGLNLDFNLKAYSFQVTNLEIGISEYVVKKIIDKYPELYNNNNLYLYAVIRENGNKMFERNTSYLSVLDQLPFPERNKMLAGIYPEFRHWEASHLSTCPLLRLMRSKVENVTEDLIVKAYGYSGLNRLFNQYPIYPSKYEKEGKWYQTFIGDSAIKERTFLDRNNFKVEALVYNMQGKLTHTQFFDHDWAGYCQFDFIPEAKFAELNLIHQYSTELSYLKFVEGDTVIDEGMKTFGYGCYVEDGNNWILGRQGFHYNVVDGEIKWIALAVQGKRVIVATGDQYYHHVTSMHAINNGRDYGVLTIDKGDTVEGLQPACMEVYLHGALLVEGIDYTVNIDKIYIFKPSVRHQKIRVRLKGLSTTGKRLKAKATGFSYLGRICFDRTVREMDVRQLQFNIGGGLYSRDEILLGNSEEENLAIGTAKPYSVTQRLATVEHYLNASSLQLRAEEDAKLDTLYDNLDQLYPITIDHSISLAIEDKYKVISVFLNEVLYKLLNENWLDSQLDNVYVLGQVEYWISDIQHLILVDACHSEHYNGEMMVVAPHAGNNQIQIKTKQLEFLNFLNEHFLGNRANIEDFIVGGLE